MNSTIQSMGRLATQAALFPQQSSPYIEATEIREIPSTYRQSPNLFGAPTLALVLGGVVGVGGVAGVLATGLTGTVVLTSANYSTGGPAIVRQDDSIHGVNSEGFSSDLSNWAQWSGKTKELLQRQDPMPQPTPSAAAKLRVERLMQIQTALGLPTLALADVLGISRQRLYKWLDASKEITLQEAKRQRLAAIEKFSKLWSDRSTVPLGSLVHEPLAGGRTMLQLLSDATLDEAKLIGALDELVQKLQGKPKSLSQRMAEAGFKRRPSAHALPADE